MMKVDTPVDFDLIFQELREKYNKVCEANYEKGTNPIIGELAWNAPENVLWLKADIREDSYEGEADQFGIKIDGTIVWGYFSHCSCYYYEDYDGTYESIAKYYKQYKIESPKLKVELQDILNNIVEDLIQ